MAAAVLFGIGKNILSQLSSQAVQEIGQWWNVEHELGKLVRNVRTIQAVIDSKDERELSQQFKYWIVELQRVMYNAQEVVDDFATEALRRRAMAKSLLPKEVRLFFSSSNQLLHGKKMTNRIKEIREALDDIINDMQKFHFIVVHPSETSCNRRDLSKNALENLPYHRKLNQDMVFGREQVFGRENDREKIKSLILSDGEHKMIAIVGGGGVGKTTLAKLVFDDRDVKEYFELRMWVFVGDVEINVDEIVEKGIRNDVRDKVENFREVSNSKKFLVENFREVLNSKKTLLVLDDIWDENPNRWSDLENLWEGSLRESRIIVTTRSSLVAKMTKNPNIYNLDYLSPQDSWSLFSSIVFREEGQPKNDTVRNNAEKIIENCGGVPLAIKIIGNMLCYLNPETDWLPYVYSELSKYPQANDDIFPILKLSYDHLPSPLRYCFAYCSLFPKGYIIEVQTLIQLWIAQGYIRPSEMGESLEDIGLRYCKVLLSRSFFQEERVDEMSGDLVWCRMHDLMHDLASLVAGDETVRSWVEGTGRTRVDVMPGNLTRSGMHDMLHELATLIAGAETVRSNSYGKYINKHTRHLSICGFNDSDSRNPLKLPESMLKAKKLRTFVSSFGYQYHRLVITSDVCGKMFKNFTSLLALDLSKLRVASSWASRHIDDWRLKCVNVLGLALEIPNSIGRLKHLRYLDLSWQEMHKLPKSITELYNLQVLKLKGCSNLIKLPKDIEKLISLRYLDCSRCWNLTHMPRGLGELVDLWYLNCDWCTSLTCMPGLEKLVNLRNLYCEECDGLTYMPCGLGKLSSLRTLTMFVVAPAGSRRSKHMACLDELGGLNLRGQLHIQGLGDVEIDESELQGAHLKQKHHLLTLSLTWKEDLENQSPTHDENILKCLEPHPNLKDLRINGYGGINFPNWFADLHSLVSLGFSNCNRCEYLPPLRGLRSLKNLKVWGCENLMYIESAADGLPQLGTRPTAFFPSLESLTVSWCFKLKGWWKVEEDNYDDEVTELPQFSRLSSLYIQSCPDLTCMPLFPTLDDTLVLDNTSIEPFQQTLKAMVPTSTTSSSTSSLVHPLSNLKDLSIGNMKDLTYLPEEGMQQLTSLQRLEISGCPHLKETCGNKDGADWHKISHIPNIRVYWEDIQTDGCYRK